MSDPRLEHLIWECLNGRLTRRELARRLSMLGISASAFSAALASRGASALAAQDATPGAAPSDEIITSPSFEG
jgi:hypothetical protein